MDLTDSQLEIVTYTVLGEAAGEGYEGMAAVAHVIRNRTQDGRYSSDPARVAKQRNAKGVYQFSAWNAGQGGNDPVSRYAKTSSTYKTAERAVRAVFGGTHPDPTGGATHYWSPRGMRAMGLGDPYWADDEATSYGRVVIGGHVFLARRPVNVTPTAMPESVRAARLRNDTRFLGSPFSIVAPTPTISQAEEAMRLGNLDLNLVTFDRTYDAGNRMSTGGLGALLGAVGIPTTPANTPRTVRINPLGQPVSDVQGAAYETARRARERATGSAGKTRQEQRLEQLIYRARPVGPSAMPAMFRTANGIAGTVPLPRDVVPAQVKRDMAVIRSLPGTPTPEIPPQPYMIEPAIYDGVPDDNTERFLDGNKFTTVPTGPLGRSRRRGVELSQQRSGVSPLDVQPQGPARGRGAAAAAKRQLAAREAAARAAAEVEEARRRASEEARLAAERAAQQRAEAARRQAQRAAEQRRQLMQRLRVNTDPRALAALLQGRSTYVGTGGGLVPTVSIGGGVRNSYGDAASGIGGSLSSSQ